MAQDLPNKIKVTHGGKPWTFWLEITLPNGNTKFIFPKRALGAAIAKTDLGLAIEQAIHPLHA